MQNVVKQVHVQTPHVWGTFNMHAAVTAGNAGYLLAIAEEPATRLSGLSDKAHEAFWAFMRDQTVMALRDPSYFPKDGFGYEVQQARGYLLAVHDGWTAGMTVPHAHGHIIGVSDAEFDVRDRMHADQLSFNDGVVFKPLATEDLELNDCFPARLRQLSGDLVKAFATASPGEDLGLTVYSARPATLSRPIMMRVEAWSAENPILTGVSNHARFWAGMQETPRWAGAPGIKWASFVKAAPA